MAFADNLATLPTVDHLAALRLLDAHTGHLVAEIPNAPGKQGSLRVYAALTQRHGGRIDAAAAQQGISLFAEHTEDARANPGKHPNIDRLFAIAEGKIPALEVQLVPKA